MNLRSLLLDEIGEWGTGRGFPSYRASQIAGWLYNRPLTAVEDMHNLPAEIRSALVEDFDCTLAVPSRVSVSQDGTTKMLVKLGDQEVVEGVIIPSGDRRTLCISSQVGCALDCRFCATARLGLRRNLEAGEIVSQVLVAREQGGSWPLTNYVFMGMGEPLANYDRLLRALEIMTARWGLGISPRRITVSTVGLVPQLKRLAADTKVHIAISLTAARDDLRDKLMPINRRYPLSELIGACHDLDLPRRKRITFEYVMLDGVNDSLDEADRLIKLLSGLRVKVNLIPFNSFDDCGFNRSPDAVIETFQERLLSAGVHATVRQSRGRDIEAACGQLAAQAS